MCIFLLREISLPILSVGLHKMMKEGDQGRDGVHGIYSEEHRIMKVHRNHCLKRFTESQNQ